jgi:hypothetical protein
MELHIILSGLFWFILIVLIAFLAGWFTQWIRVRRERQPVRYCEKLIEVKSLMKVARTDKENLNVWNELMYLLTLQDKDPEEVKILIEGFCKKLKV